MRVLHVIPTIAPAYGGPSASVLDMVRSLSDAGVDAEILTTDDWGKERSTPFQTGELVEYKGVKIRAFKRTFLSFRQFNFSAGLSRWLWKNVRNYDLVHIHYLFTYPSSCAAWVAGLQKVPFIIRTLGQLSPWAFRHKAVRKHLYFWLFEKRNMKKAKALHVTTKKEKEHVRKVITSHPEIFCLPLGVREGARIKQAHAVLRQKQGLDSSARIILFLGRLHPVKGVEDLITIMPQVIKKKQNSYLLIAGEGDAPYQAKLKRLCENKMVAANVRFCGFVTGDEKALLLQGSDVMALLSHTENFGVSIAEAMINRLPLVVSDQVCLADEIRNAKAGTVVGNHPEFISQSILNLLEDEKLRKEMGDAGYYFAVKEFTWDEISKRLADQYRVLLNEESK